jgi:predicted heme/steroid binding protein
MFGREFKVLPSAMASFANKKIGQVVTILLTSDLSIAGLVTSDVAQSTAVGIVESASGYSARVRLLNGLVISGNTGRMADSMAGEIVSVYSTAAGQISLMPITGSAVTGTLDLENNRLGTAPLSPAVRIFERAGKGDVVQIKLSDITLKTVSGNRVLFAQKDSKGAVTMLLLDDVTGDRYTYGVLEYDTQHVPSIGNEGSGINTTVTVINGSGSVGPVVTGVSFSTGDLGGVSAPVRRDDSAAVVLLKKLGTVRRSDFVTKNGKMYVTVGGETYPVSDAVECYSKDGNAWFKSLADARSFSETLTVYAERAASEGGKIRIVVA